VDADRVRARVETEVPHGLLFDGYRGDETAALRDMQTETRTGLALLVGGLRADSITTTTEEPRPSEDGQGFVFATALTAPYSPAHGPVTLENGNTPELDAFFRTDITVGRGVRVVDASTFGHRRDGSVGWSTAGRWRQGDEHRTARVEVRAESLAERIAGFIRAGPAVVPAFEARGGPQAMALALMAFVGGLASAVAAMAWPLIARGARRGPGRFRPPAARPRS
jgi:hypothetical protein